MASRPATESGTDDANASSGPEIPVWLVWAVALAFVLSGLGDIALLDNNEGLYAEIPREMLAAGFGDWRTWILPRLNGLPYLEKPPLLYWLTALSFALFGMSEWSARAVPALAALACVWLIMSFGRAVGREQVGRLGALIFISGTGVAAMARLLMFEMLLAAFLCAALMLAWQYLAEGRAALLRMSYACLALAVLAKGLVALALYALVLLTVVLVFALQRRNFLQMPRTWLDPAAIAIFAAIALPWHLAAWVAEPNFAWLYFVNEHWLRFQGLREPHDYYSGAWWYYLPRSAVYLFPWSFLLIGLIAARRGKETAADGRKLQCFLTCAWLVPLLFFSLSFAKANYYLIPVMPFAALQLAIVLEERQWKGFARALPAAIICLAALVAGMWLWFWQADQVALAALTSGIDVRLPLLVLTGGTAAAALAGAFAAWRIRRNWVLAYLAPAMAMAIGLWLALALLQPVASAREVARYLATHLPDREVYLYRDFERRSALPFYLKRIIPVVDSRSSDLYWGGRLAKDGILLTTEQFQALGANRRIAIVVSDPQADSFRAAGMDRRFPVRQRIGDASIFAD